MNPKRYARICQMMAMRQPGLTIYLAEVNKPHNVSVVIRTVDAVGIRQIDYTKPTCIIMGQEKSISKQAITISNGLQYAANKAAT